MRKQAQAALDLAGKSPGGMYEQAAPQEHLEACPGSNNLDKRPWQKRDCSKGSASALQMRCNSVPGAKQVSPSPPGHCQTGPYQRYPAAPSVHPQCCMRLLSAGITPSTSWQACICLISKGNVIPCRLMPSCKKARFPETTMFNRALCNRARCRQPTSMQTCG